MKKLLFTSAFFLTTMIAFAQNNKEIEKGIKILDTAKTAIGQTVAADHFAQLAKTDQNWLTLYYAAYSQLLLGIRGNQDQETKDYIYDKALSYVSKADSLSPNNSEIYLLKGYIVFMKMAVYPQKRAMTMIVASNQLIEKAIALNPENPRAHLMKGQNAFYTPEMFGGGKPAAKALLTVAVEKFENFNAAALHPNWGKQRTAELLSEIK